MVFQVCSTFLASYCHLLSALLTMGQPFLRRDVTADDIWRGRSDMMQGYFRRHLSFKYSRKSRRSDASNHACVILSRSAGQAILEVKE